MAGATTTTIDNQDAESFRIIGGRADCGLIILCDHACNAFPQGYGTLGLPAEQLLRHIAYDIGAEAITERLAAQLGAPALLTRFSRLLIDPNRGADDPTLIMRLSDGAIIPGNKDVDDTERATRIARFHRPYHAAIDQVIDRCLATGVAPLLLSIHSFTESWKGAPRPWHVGILWDKDPRLAKPLLDGFSARGDLIVGDNEPYKGCLVGDTMWQHGTERGLAHAIIEYRQDLVRDATGQAQWAQLTHDILMSTMACAERGPPLHRIEHHGSTVATRRAAARDPLALHSRE
jgi:predicted N-formylglutamate amidohydrolase